MGHECRKIEPLPKKPELKPAWTKKKVLETEECSKKNDSEIIEEGIAWQEVPVSNKKQQKENEKLVFQLDNNGFRLLSNDVTEGSEFLVP